MTDQNQTIETPEASTDAPMTYTGPTGITYTVGDILTVPENLASLLADCAASHTWQRDTHRKLLTDLWNARSQDKGNDKEFLNAFYYELGSAANTSKFQLSKFVRDLTMALDIALPITIDFDAPDGPVVRVREPGQGEQISMTYDAVLDGSGYNTNAKPLDVLTSFIETATDGTTTTLVDSILETTGVMVVKVVTPGVDYDSVMSVDPDAYLTHPLIAQLAGTLTSYYSEGVAEPLNLIVLAGGDTLAVTAYATGSITDIADIQDIVANLRQVVPTAACGAFLMVGPVGFETTVDESGDQMTSDDGTPVADPGKPIVGIRLIGSQEVADSDSVVCSQSFIYSSERGGLAPYEFNVMDENWSIFQ